MMETFTFFCMACFVILTQGYELPDGYMQYKQGWAWSPKPGFQQKEVILTDPPYLKLNEALPKDFSWGSAGPNNSSLITPPRNQFLPNPCGSCWAVAAMGALSDRLKIETYLKTKQIPVDINLAPQYLLDLCFYSKYDCGSCNGGSSNIAYQVIHETSVSDESCSPYLGREVSLWAESNPKNYICRECNWFTGDCFLTQPNPNRNFSVSEYGSLNWKNFYPNNTKTNVTMVNAMMNEIHTRGPISCLMNAHAKSFQNYTGGYVLVDNTKYSGTTHFISLIGWGVRESDGLEYWIGRNSFGTIWGDSGFFMAQRGVNIYNMEEACDWATVQFPKKFFINKKIN